jgi:hypothetical protein
MVEFTMLFIGLTSMMVMIGYTNENKKGVHYVKH